MKTVSFEVKDDVFEKVNAILGVCDLDMEIAIKLLFNRLMREQSAGFLLSNVNARVITQDVISGGERLQLERGEMRKALAINLFKEKGHSISRDVTYSSKNRTTHNYWANPSISVVKKDWAFILNDWESHKLYLFVIPKNSIAQSVLIPRSDQPELLDVQILGQVPGYVDKRSGFSFRQFLKDELAY